MTPEEFHARCKAYAMGWEETGRIMEEMRREDVRRSKTTDFRAFDGMAQWEAERRPPAPTSGLVEQQRLFMKARAK